jgi:hypothetical protein
MPDKPERMLHLHRAVCDGCVVCKPQKFRAEERPMPDSPISRAELTRQIGELAKAAKPANSHIFTVLNVLVGAMLMDGEEQYATAALKWMREAAGNL